MLYMDSLSSFVIMQLWFCQVKYIIPQKLNHLRHLIHENYMEVHGG